MKVVVTVVGARPQFVKASAVSHAFATRSDVREVLVHTGQHYDPGLSDVFFDELAIPPPAHHLGVGSGSHGRMTGQLLERIEEVLVSVRPDAVLVYGDTNSTLAGALAAAKLNIDVAHVEAGLRSFNRRMPEEVNRVLTDHASQLLFCPTKASVEQLAREGITQNVHHVGDVMFDVAVSTAERARRTSRFRSTLGAGDYVLATLHRAETTDDPARLAAAVDALTRLSRERKVVFPVHPRTRNALAKHDIKPGVNVELIEPVGFVDMVWLEMHAALVVTDSGGVQKEAYFHRVPCVTVRTETEWTETVDAGWNRLADPSDSNAIVEAARSMMEPDATRRDIAEYGTGAASSTIVALLVEHLVKRCA